MVSSATLGNGYTIKNASGYEIAEVKAIGKFGGKKADVNVTSTDSSGNCMEYIPGMMEGGSIPMTCVFVATDTSGQVQAITDFLAGTRAAYTITMATGSTYSGLMYVNEYQVTNVLEKEITIDIVLKVAAYPTFTP